MRDTVIQNFFTDKGYQVKLQYMDRETDFHDFLYEYTHFYFWDDRAKRITDVEDGRENDKRYSFSQESLGIALGILKPEDITDDEEDQAMYKHYADDILEKYRVFPVGIYEHSLFKFYIGYKTDRWDSSFGGVLLIDKKQRQEYVGTREPTDEDTKITMERFSDRFNGRIYELCVYEPDVYKNDKGNTHTEREYVDGISYLFSDDDPESVYEREFSNYYGKQVEEE